MRILLDCRPLQKAGLGSERSRLIFSAVALLAGEGVEWVMVVDQRYRKGSFPTISGEGIAGGVIAGEGIAGEVIVRRALPGRAGWKWWYERQLPRLVRRQGVDMVWLTGGVAGAGFEVPQVCWMTQVCRVPGRAQAVAEGGVRGCLERAALLFCFSERDRVWLTGIRPDAVEKIRVLRAFPGGATRPMGDGDKERVKARWTQGKEYFLADLTGAREEVAVELLKAYSLFKKRQQTQMRLVLTGLPEGAKKIKQRLQTYKYRGDVDWPGGDVDWPAGDEEVRVALTGAAYAVIFPFERDGLGVGLLDVWKAGVPAIVVKGGFLGEIAGEAAPGFAPDDPASLAAELMRIYKEEDLRAALIGKGFERLKIYSLENFRQVLRVITEIAIF